MSTAPILALDHVGYQVQNPDLTILSSLSLSIAAGQNTSIMGTSGSGKTTLLSLMAGLIMPTQGTVTLLGKASHTYPDAELTQLRQRTLSFIHQDFQLLDCLSALDNVALPLKIAGDLDAKAIASQCLERVGCADRQRHYPHQLSGGERQRVAIARSLAQNPTLLFADEPTGNLDSQTSRRILDLLFDTLSHATIVMVSHDPIVETYTQQNLILSAGDLTCHTH